MDFLLAVYIPNSAVETVKKALFTAGAGTYENYDQCCWQTQGQGQFRPLDKANPTIGTQGKLEIVDEIKMEMICSKANFNNVISALKKAHPYEEPAYYVLALQPSNET